ncbi:MAG: transposase [Planctomycetes bacterium]|nr:transposase [Planctomycetota bacterium]
MNRGVGQRSIFERALDVRRFRQHIAEVVRAGDIEVHAWCVLTTHFHLLVRSPIRRLDVAMQHIEQQYSTWFNRTRGRDGPLYRSRYRSRSIDTLGYRRTVVRYIDANVVNAGIVTDSARWAHGSMVAFLRGRGQPWLSRAWIEREALRATGASTFDAEVYRQAFPPLLTPETRAWIESRIESPADEPDPLDDLLASSSDQFLHWLIQRTEIADGTLPGLPLASFEGVRRELGARRRRMPPTDPRNVDPWTRIEVGLLRDIAGATYRRIGQRMGFSPQRACVIRQRHVRALREDPHYARVAAETARDVLLALHAVPAIPARRTGSVDDGA